MISTLLEDEQQIAAPVLESRDSDSPDLSELLRLVIIRNNRLQRLLALSAPGIMVRNEKRMLLEAHGALFEHSDITELVAQLGADAFTRYFHYIAGIEIDASVVDAVASSPAT